MYVCVCVCVCVFVPGLTHLGDVVIHVEMFGPWTMGGIEIETRAYGSE